MIEFSGERVIPGHVEDDLWAEHIARYAFAARFAAGRRVLDLGCGTGYGTAELARHATEAVGVDISPEAIDYASAHYRSAHFVLASAEDVPLHDTSFDVVVAFELIEHLSDWRMLLEQTRRVLHPGGVFIVSTPNILYDAEVRGVFDYAGFRSALEEFFPHVKILMQDCLKSLAFYEPDKPGRAQAQLLNVSNNPAASNVFVAICSLESLPPIQPFVFVPSTASLLREREDRIRKLMLERSETTETIEKLKIAVEEKSAWALETGRKLQHREQEVATAAKTLDQARRDAAETAGKAEQLARERDALKERIEQLQRSAWLKLGRALRLGPKN